MSTNEDEMTKGEFRSTTAIMLVVALLLFWLSGRLISWITSLIRFGLTVGFCLLIAAILVMYARRFLRRRRS